MKKDQTCLCKLFKTRRLMHLLCLGLLISGSSLPAFASSDVDAMAAVQQNRTIRGVVMDHTQEPVAGASVIVEGTTNGTITDMNGRFSLDVPSGKKIVVSFVGYISQTIEVAPGKDTRVVLLEDAKILDEVIVVGYGTQKMRNVTGAIATINPAEIEDLPVSNLGAALRGMVPGLSVSGGEARPGSQASLNIRGATSLTKDGGTSDPIYVVDDFIVDATTFNNLNPNEIESVSILKDAAAAVYGARSAQGAVLVRTKRGHEGAPKISYSGQFVYNDEIFRPKMLDAYQYGVFWNSYKGADPTKTYDHTKNFFQADELEAMKGMNYDWLGDTWTGAFSMKHSLNLSGGSKNATYFASMSYYTQEGNISTLDYERWNYRAGADIKLASHLKVGLQISGDYGYTHKTFNKVGGENDENDYYTLLTTPRYIPSHVGDLPLVRYGVSNSQQNAIQQYNFYELENRGDVSKTTPQNMRINTSIEYSFDWNKYLKGLRVKMQYSKGISTSKTNRVGSQYSAYYFATRGGSGNHLYIGDELTDPSNLRTVTVKNGNHIWREMSQSDKYQLNFILSYNRKFGLHNVGGLFTIEKIENNLESVRYYREDPLEFNNGEYSTATGKMDGLTDRTESGFLSYVGRFNYSYADKYLFEFLFRSDASTKFAPENYWGFFPSVSAGWVISEENWFKEKVGWMDLLKIRASFGLLGKDNTKAWQWRQSYSYQRDKGAVFGTNSSANIGWGMKMGSAPNYNARWDKNYKTNTGIDARFLQNRLSFGFDFYYDRAREILVQRDGIVPVTIGSALASENFDEIDSYGFELSLGWRDRIGKVNYYVRLNTGYSNARYRKKDWPEILTFSDVYPNGPVDMGTWGYDCLGMFRNQQQIDEYVQQNNITDYLGLTPEQIRPGMLIYRDVRGEMNPDGTYAAPDGIINERDYIQLTKRKNNPYGFTLNLGGDWKGISVSAQITTSWGGFSELPGKAKSISEKELEYTNVPSFWKDMFVAEDVLDAEGRIVAKQNLTAKYPNMGFTGVNSKTSNYWQISSFRMTLRNLTIGYAVPKTAIRKIGIEGCRFTLTGTNLFSFFNPYPDNFTDPIVGYGSYPTLRNFSLGVNVSF